MNESSYQLESLYQEEIYNIRPKVVVVIPVPWEKITEGEQVLLSKILASVKLTPASVKIITVKEFTMTDIEAYVPSKIIAFGSVIKDTKELVQPYKKYNRNGIDFLQADVLGQLDDSKKKNLWNVLREMFLVS